jgi:hypothetical protein
VDADCDDHDACTGVERCSAGACQEGTELDCQDTEDCTTDGCGVEIIDWYAELFGPLPEAPLRIVAGFTPKWFRGAMDLDYGERWHTDPEYRRRTVVEMKRTLNRRFPELLPGGPDPEQTPATTGNGLPLTCLNRIGWPSTSAAKRAASR